MYKAQKPLQSNNGVSLLLVVSTNFCIQCNVLFILLYFTHCILDVNLISYGLKEDKLAQRKNFPPFCQALIIYEVQRYWIINATSWFPKSPNSRFTLLADLMSASLHCLFTRTFKYLYFTSLWYKWLRCSHSLHFSVWLSGQIQNPCLFNSFLTRIWQDVQKVNSHLWVNGLRDLLYRVVIRKTCLIVQPSSVIWEDVQICTSSIKAGCNHVNELGQDVWQERIKFL